MTQHTITYRLTEAAQRDAARAGRPAAARQTLTLPQEHVPRALDLRATVDEDGAVTLDLRSAVRAAHDEAAGYARHSRGAPEALQTLDVDPRYPEGYADPATALDAIAERVEAAARAGAELLEEERAEARERIESMLATEPGPDAPVPAEYETRRAPELQPRVDAWLAARERAREARLTAHAEVVAAYERGEGEDPGTPQWSSGDLNSRVYERRQALREEAAQRRTAQIAALVRDWGDDSQRARLADDMLPESEAMDLIRQRVLAPLEGLAAYERIGVDDLDHDEGCPEEDITCSRDEAESLGRDEYAALCTIRAAAEQARGGLGEGATLGTEVREHTCSCDDCDATLTRYGVSVRLAWGKLSVQREYAL